VFVGKLELSTPPTFLTHDAAAEKDIGAGLGLVLDISIALGGRRGVVVTRLIRSAKLLYAGPG